MRIARLTGSTFGHAAAIGGTAVAVALFAGCGDGASSGSSMKQLTTATDGVQIFKEANCAGCHTLAAAGAKGPIGPNLDDKKPSASTVVEKVTNGDGSMPSFKNRLTTEQIQTVADYVEQVAGK